jgi:hypothetical protein
MATNAAKAEVNEAAKQGWLIPVLMTWIVPGSGYFLIKEAGRGALMAGSSVLLFLLGLMMRGVFFEWQTGDLLTTVIYGGGYICHLCSGSLYFLANALGYSAPDVAGHVVDYGTKFLVASGLVNVLSMVDVYEIVTGKKR